MTALPALFLSHGAPDLPIRSGPTQAFLRHFSSTIPTPKAIVVLSAHWLTQQPTVSTALQPKTMYDFGGFPSELYQIQYPAPGAPDLASRLQALLASADLPLQTDPSRGFDHGVWTPLSLLYPNAQIPVLPLSLQGNHGPEYHYRLGQHLAPLRSEGVLIIGSGAATHNLGAFSAYAAPPPDWAIAFDNWLTDAVHRHDLAALLNYRQQAPYSAQNHPTDEHLLPLFVALGAGGTGTQIHQGFTYGAFSMSAFAFGSSR